MYNVASVDQLLITVVDHIPAVNVLCNDFDQKRDE